MKFEVIDTRKFDRYERTQVEIPDEDFEVLKEFSILEPFGVIVDDEVRIYVEVYPGDGGEVISRIRKTIEATYKSTTDTFQLCIRYRVVKA